MKIKKIPDEYKKPLIIVGGIICLIAMLGGLLSYAITSWSFTPANATSTPIAKVPTPTGTNKPSPTIIYSKPPTPSYYKPAPGVIIPVAPKTTTPKPTWTSPRYKVGDKFNWSGFQATVTKVDTVFGRLTYTFRILRDGKLQPEQTADAAIVDPCEPWK